MPVSYGFRDKLTDENAPLAEVEEELRKALGAEASTTVRNTDFEVLVMAGIAGSRADQSIDTEKICKLMDHDSRNPIFVSFLVDRYRFWCSR